MRRVLKVYLLIALSFMQTVLWLSPLSIGAQAEQMAHMAVHVQDIDHHHHEDESLHLCADSHSTAAHFHGDDGFQPIGLTALSGASEFAAMPGALPAAPIPEPPTVFLDRLLRPPSHAA
ncbi:hypothetical protein [Acidovorax sp. RAC01]|uniref:hypothetical protein n=1 Tax=Acidovorax sp. RAC01 TaxID=1842533 RepID=UPI00083E7B1A|nr:hypothetical protein [Acidovorax sp. RAC01]AOG23828.1 hypothetical protein BSY15_3671 [Acidovorax sp. RAC01]